MRKLFPIPYFHGKTCHKKSIIELIPDFDVFIEPTCGSAEVSLELMKKYYELKVKKIFYLNDINRYVMAFHEQMKNNYRMTDYLGRLSKPEYERIKNKKTYCDYDVFNLWMNSKMYYMNFENDRFIGEYNEKFQVKIDKIKYINKLYNFHEVHFRCKDYRDFFDDIVWKTNNVIVYFDIEEPIDDFLKTFDLSYVRTSYRGNKEFLSRKFKHIENENYDNDDYNSFSSEWSIGESSGIDIEKMTESEYLK